MKPFMDETFLLNNQTAVDLYEKYAKNQPIIDYHCHINPREIAENRQFDNITQVWLGGDHYKWRLIRSNGVPEEEITGSADDRTKFQRFAEALPKAIGNPMYHWTHLELKRYFGYQGILNGDTAETVWQLCNEKLKSPELSVRGLITSSNVEAVGTTDDPADTLEWHRAIREDKTCKIRVMPTFRPDKAVNIDKPGFVEYIAKLGDVAGCKIDSVDTLEKVMLTRLDLFDEMGCRASDHGLDYIMYTPASDETVEEIFQKALRGEKVSPLETDQYKTRCMMFYGREYAHRGWAMQLHYGVQRNTNDYMFKRLGPDTGFDCISTRSCSEGITTFCNALASENALPKTIFYSLNPADNELLGTVLGCFQSTEACGKMQHGSAWWFNDTKTGMENQLISLANLSLLGNFVGMLTDSRSFLSYTRHEYFRRILCNLVGTWVENGEYPNDEKALAAIIEGVSYRNIKKYLGI